LIYIGTGSLLTVVCFSFSNFLVFFVFFIFIIFFLCYFLFFVQYHNPQSFIKQSAGTGEGFVSKEKRFDFKKVISQEPGPGSYSPEYLYGNLNKSMSLVEFVHYCSTFVNMISHFPLFSVLFSLPGTFNMTIAEQESLA